MLLGSFWWKTSFSCSWTSSLASNKRRGTQAGVSPRRVVQPTRPTFRPPLATLFFFSIRQFKIIFIFKIKASSLTVQQQSLLTLEQGSLSLGLAQPSLLPASGKYIPFFWWIAYHPHSSHGAILGAAHHGIYGYQCGHVIQAGPSIWALSSFGCFFLSEMKRSWAGHRESWSCPWPWLGLVRSERLRYARVRSGCAWG